MHPPRLYAIADLDALGAEQLVEAVATMAECGVEWIQLRAKTATGRDCLAWADRCGERLVGTRARLWIDDRVDVAAVASAVVGVHVGQRDLPPAAARRVLGPTAWIGASTHDAEQLAIAAEDPTVDVIAVGPVFGTISKRNPGPPVGLEMVARARRATSKPLVAIGGIDAGNAAAVLAAGADTVAVLGAICRGDLQNNCRRMLAAVGSG